MGFVYVCVTAADLAEIQTTNFKPKELWLKNMAKRCQKGMYGGVIYNKSIYVLIYIYTLSDIDRLGCFQILNTTDFSIVFPGNPLRSSAGPLLHRSRSALAPRARWLSCSPNNLSVDRRSGFNPLGICYIAMV
jgi:hypothetical protein